MNMQSTEEARKLIEDLLDQSRSHYRFPKLAVQAMDLKGQLFRAYEAVEDAERDFTVVDVDFSPLIIKVSDSACSVKHCDEEGNTYLQLKELNSENFEIVKGSDHFRMWRQFMLEAKDEKRRVYSNVSSTSASGSSSPEL